MKRPSVWTTNSTRAPARMTLSRSGVLLLFISRSEPVFVLLSVLGFYPPCFQTIVGYDISTHSSHDLPAVCSASPAGPMRTDSAATKQQPSHLNRQPPAKHCTSDHPSHGLNLPCRCKQARTNMSRLKRDYGYALTISIRAACQALILPAGHHKAPQPAGTKQDRHLPPENTDSDSSPAGHIPVAAPGYPAPAHRPLPARPGPPRYPTATSAPVADKNPPALRPASKT